MFQQRKKKTSMKHLCDILCEYDGVHYAQTGPDNKYFKQASNSVRSAYQRFVFFVFTPAKNKLFSVTN